MKMPEVTGSTVVFLTEQEILAKAKEFARFLAHCGRPELAVNCVDIALKDEQFGVNVYWKLPQRGG